MGKVKDKTFNTGLTLIELLVTLSVASIMLTVAVPSFRIFVQDSRLAAQINSIASALMLAKNEAITRNSFATVCPSTNGTGCTGGTVWSNGWIVFADANGDGGVDAGEQIIQVGSALTGGNTLTTSNGRIRITFAATGTSLGMNATFSLCDKRGAAASKVLRLNNQGRLRSETGTGTCS